MVQCLRGTSVLLLLLAVGTSVLLLAVTFWYHDLFWLLVVSHDDSF